MRQFRHVAMMAVFMGGLLHFSGPASADHRYRSQFLWPRIYLPEISGNLYRDDWEDEEDYIDLESREDFIRRHRHDRRVVLDLYEDDEDLEPRYDPPPRKKLKAKKPAKTATVKKSPSRTATTATIVKPKVKPRETSTASLSQPSPNKLSVVSSANAATGAASVKPQTVAPKTTAKALPPLAPAAKAPAKPAATSQVANATPTGNAIGCSKGAEIVSGYGFTSVKPRTCTGASYSFAATRGAAGYLIKLSSATGEITDVQKLK